MVAAIALANSLPALPNRQVSGMPDKTTMKGGEKMTTTEREEAIDKFVNKEIFACQSMLIEDQIATIQIAKDDELVSKYNLEVIVMFMKEKFANLGKTYQLSNLSQIRVLLSSITLTGMTWSYPGLSNSQISPIYQQIRMFEDKGVGSSAAGESRTPTPLLTGALKAPVSAIPPPRQYIVFYSKWGGYSSLIAISE